MNTCLKSDFLLKVTEKIDAFNEELVDLFETIDEKYDNLAENIKDFARFSYTVVMNEDGTNDNYNIITANNKINSGDNVELKEIVCVKDNAVTEHITVKTESISPSVVITSEVNPYTLAGKKSNMRPRSQSHSGKFRVDSIYTWKPNSPVSEDATNSMGSFQSEESWDIINDVF